MSAEAGIAASGFSEMTFYLSRVCKCARRLGRPGLVMGGTSRLQIVLQGLMGRTLSRDHGHSTAAGAWLIVASYI